MPGVRVLQLPRVQQDGLGGVAGLLLGGGVLQQTGYEVPERISGYHSLGGETLANLAPLVHFLTANNEQKNISRTFLLLDNVKKLLQPLCSISSTTCAPALCGLTCYDNLRRKDVLSSSQNYSNITVMIQ